MKYSDKDLFQLVAEVESEFASLLNKAESQTEQADAEEVAEGYNEEEIQELETIYSSMTKAEAEIHYKTLKKSLFGQESEEETEEQSEEAEEIQAPTESFEKSEKEIVLSTQNEQLVKENEELKKSLEEVKTHIQNFVTRQAPQRKAITDIEVLRKTEEQAPKELTKSEIDSKLKSKVRESSLSKSDRDAINNYYLFNGSTESIRHLL